MLEFLAQSQPHHVSQWIEHGGYVMLFLLLLLCGVGLPLPEELPLLSAGVLVATGHMDPVMAGVCAWTGIVGGDGLLYMASRRYGRRITQVGWLGKHITMDRINTASRLFHRYGMWVVLGGRMVAGVRWWMVIAAGVLHYNALKFFIVNGLGAILSAGIIMALGYWAGSSFGSLDAMWEWIKSIQNWIFTIVLLAVVVLGIYLVWKRPWRRSAAKPETDADPVPAEPLE